MGGDAELVTVAEALFDFEGVRADNLRFEKGDIITVLEMNESGWWKGSDSSGNTGIFPYNFVQIQEDVVPEYPIVKALFDFSTDDPKCLGFGKGDTLTVLKEISADWWEAKSSDGSIGLIPSNRVEKTGENDEKAAKEEKKRWSMIKKEKKKEAEKAAKARASLQRKLEREEKKRKDEAEKKRLQAEMQAAAERAKRAEEELERVKAEAALLKRQQQEAEAKRNSRARKKNEKEKQKIKDQARLSAVRWQGMSPGPPPELEAERLKYLNEQEVEREKEAKKEKPKKKRDSMFGPAPDPPMPPLRTQWSAEAVKQDSDEEPEKEEPVVEEEVEEPKMEKKKTNFVYNSKFANLGGGNKCRKCGKTVGFADKVTALGSDWHKGCFRCSTCSMVLRQGEWREHNSDPYCKNCHAKGFGPTGFGYGGVMAAVDAGKVKDKNAKADAKVDDRPVFEQGLSA